MKILLTVVVLLVLLLQNDVAGQKLDFPVQSCASGFITGNYWGCLGQLANRIWSLHRWGEDTPITLCGIACTGNLKGRVSKWQWKWDGRFRCDSKAPGIVGQDTKKSRNGAMEWAIKDFLNKAVQSGKVRVEDFNC